MMAVLCTMLLSLRRPQYTMPLRKYGAVRYARMLMVSQCDLPQAIAGLGSPDFSLFLRLLPTSIARAAPGRNGLVFVFRALQWMPIKRNTPWIPLHLT